MGRIFIISDLHLGHNSMAVKRGFVNSEHHDNFLTYSWNAVVHKRDTVWILGDISMEKKTPYHLLRGLNGIKNVVGGNHDRHQDVPELLKYVNSFCGATKLKGYILTHIPIHPSEVDRFYGNIHGHVHENTIDDERYINVCPEAIGYAPILFDELISNK